MCDPVSIGLTLASTLANQAAQSKVNKAQSSAINAQMARNTGYQQQADKVMHEEAIPGFTLDNQNALLADSQADRMADSEQYAGGGDTLKTTGSADAGYKTELAKMIADHVAQGRNQAEAATRIGSYGDLGLGNSMLLQDTGSKINTIGGNSQRDSAILPYELQGAQSKGAGLRTLGDILGAGATMYSLGGGMGNMFTKPGGAMAPIVDKSYSAMPKMWA